MKNRFWKQAVLAMAFSVAFSAAAFAEETEVETAETETAETEAAETEAAVGELSDELFDFQIKIDGTVYQFPMSYEEFTAAGWEMNDSYSTPEDQLSPSTYQSVRFSKGGIQVTTDVLNLGINTAALTDCLVGGITVDDYYWDGETKVELAKGIEKGVSSLDDITEAYGNPTDTYEGDLYTELTYQKESYCDIELYVYKETGTLDKINLRNFVEPEGFDAGSASEEVPEEVAAYEAPTELGDDLLSYNVEFDGVLYHLPCPVSALLENGWTLDKDNTEETISAHSSGWVYFIKGGNTFHLLARNTADYATIPENCWVRDLSAGGYGMELSLNLPGGLGIGTAEEELVAAFDAAGIKYETYDGSSYRTYTIGEDSWNGIIFTVDTDEEGSLHEPGKVYEIEVEHE